MDRVDIAFIVMAIVSGVIGYIVLTWYGNIFEERLDDDEEEKNER